MIDLQKIRIVHGDTLEILPQLIEEGVRADCLVCDPPYLLTSGGCTPPSDGQIRMRGLFAADQYENGGNLFEGDCPEWRDFMPFFYQVLSENAHAYVMADSKNQLEMQNQALSAGFRFHNLLYWDKRTATPGRWYMKNAEYVGLFFKGKAFQINDCGSRQGVSLNAPDESQHPTEKPVALMQHYIENSTQPGQIVIDPFMGSGTTALACIRAGRGFIGIERDQVWFDVAKKRIEDAVGSFQENLF